MTTQQENGVSIRGKQIRRDFVKFLQKSTSRFILPKKWTYLEIVKHILNIAFWGLIYLMGSYLTFVLLIQVTKEYQSQPTNLDIKFMMDTTMTIPDYTLCIQGPIS